MKERLIPPADTPQEAMHSAPLILNWGGVGHTQEYIVGLPGIIGVRRDKEIPASISRDLQSRLGNEREVINRGSRIEILGERDDEFVVGAISDYFDELKEVRKPRYWEKNGVTGRGLNEYILSMHLTREELSGKRVLDVGAGAANFARDVQAKGLDTNVFSLDPSYALDADTRASKRSLGIGWRGKIEADPPNSVAGVAEQTPFADSSFDIVLASSSVPEYFPTDDMDDYQNRLLNTLVEFDRILKVNGQIRIFPSSVLMESVEDSYDELPYEKAALKDFLDIHHYTSQSISLDSQEDEWRGVLILQKQLDS